MTASRGIVLDDAVTRVIPQGRRLGLVIGIDAYGADSGIPRLNAAVADATAIHAVMVDPGCGRFAPELTTVLTDGAATDSNIKIALERLRKQVTSDDEVWFFYAGHALLVDGQHRLLPVNAQREFVDATSVDFAELFNKIRCRRKLVFLDCCHAGASDASTRNVHEVDDVFRSYQASGTVTYCSSEGDQKSVELPEHGHGAFTYWLERGLRGDADADGSGVVTSDELWQYVCKHVEDDARRLTGRTQTPRLKSDTSGAFALSVNIGAIRAREAEEARAQAEQLAALERLEIDRKSLRQLLGEDEATHLSTDELRAAIKVLEGDESNRSAQQIRKALEAFRANGDGDDAALRVRGALRATASAAPASSASPRSLNTKEFERRVAAEVAARSGSVPAAKMPDGVPATPPSSASVQSSVSTNSPTPKPASPEPSTKASASASTDASREASTETVKAKPPSVVTPAPPRRWGRRIGIAVGVLVVLFVIGSLIPDEEVTSSQSGTLDSSTVSSALPLSEPDPEGWREILPDSDVAKNATRWKSAGDVDVCAWTPVNDGFEVAISRKEATCSLRSSLELSGELRFTSTLQWFPGAGGAEAVAGVKFGELMAGSARCDLDISAMDGQFQLSCYEPTDNADSKFTILATETSDAIDKTTNELRIDVLSDRYEIRINGRRVFSRKQALPQAVVFDPYVTLGVEPTTQSRLQFNDIRIFTRPLPETSAATPNN